MAKHICIDLGTSSTKISEKNKGIILNQPTVAAIDNASGRIIAAGQDAKELLGKTPKEISVITPIEKSAVSDFDATCAVLKTFLTGILPKGSLRPKATVCLPHGITDVEKRALLEAISRSGAKSVYTLDASVAAAIGAGITVTDATGNMILDIGGGRTCAAVISFGGIVCATSDVYGGDKMDLCIIDYLKKNYGILIGKKTAENIKISIGAAFPDEAEKSMTVMGRDEKTGLPKEITVTSSHITEAVSPVLIKIIDIIKKTLENTPAELAQDLHSNGIYLCGGASNLAGFAKFIEANIGIAARACQNAAECAALGANSAFDEGGAQ